MPGKKKRGEQKLSDTRYKPTFFFCLFFFRPRTAGGKYRETEKEKCDCCAGRETAGPLVHPSFSTALRPERRAGLLLSLK